MSTRLMLAMALVAMAMTHAVTASNDPDRFNLAAADRQIIPGYQALAKATANLDDVAHTSCEQPLPNDAKLKPAFAEAFLAWQAVQQIRFGPIEVLNRGFRYQLWPDKRGTVGKHLRQLLASRDPKRLQGETFADGSIAVQGFGAIERLLFDLAPSDDADGLVWRCAVITAITTNLRTMSSALVEEWQSIPDNHRTLFATASRGNIYYESDREVRTRLLNSLHTQLEFLVTRKLDRPLGKSIERAMPKRAEAWRSGLSLDALRINLQSSDAVYRAAFAPLVADASLAKRLDQGFKDALASVSNIRSPLAEAVKTPDQRKQVEQLRAEIAILQNLVGEHLTKALDLPLGFNSLDGD